MTKRDLKALAKWNGWLMVQISAIYSMGAWSQSEPRNLLDKVQNIACALNVGARMAVQPDTGPLYARFADMPPVPAVWPHEYPFELAWHFLEYVQALSAYEISSPG